MAFWMDQDAVAAESGILKIRLRLPSMVPTAKPRPEKVAERVESPSECVSFAKHAKAKEAPDLRCQQRIAG
ncbi:MAG: hypothetical protein P8P66_15010, partial [Paracoccaceae bacterium]|nr:hypothetical protein [Paracoccaceae bacterium]